MIVVLASIELNGGKREEFLAEFRRLVPLVRAEKGCIEYFPSVDHATHLPDSELQLGNAKAQLVVFLCTFQPEVNLYRDPAFKLLDAGVLCVLARLTGRDTSL